MKKLFKILGILGLGVAILGVALSVVLKLYFTPEKIRALVEQQVTAQLHRQVKLGDVSIGLFSGLSLSDFQLSEAPDFSKGTFISSEKFVVRPRLLPLLSKKLFVKEVELIRPNVTVIRYPDGKTYNFSSLTAKETPNESAAAPKAGGASPLAFLVSKASIESGVLKFIDQSPAAQSIEVNPLNLTVRNFTLAGPVDLKTDGKIKIKGADIGLDFDGMVNLVKASANIKKCVITNGATKISIDGNASELTGSEPSIDLTTVINNLEPAFIKIFASVPSSVRLTGPITGKIETKGTFNSMGLNYKLALASLELSGSGKVNHATEPNRTFQLAINTNEFPIAGLLGMLAPDTLSKDMKLSGTTRANMTLNGTADAGTFKINGDAKSLDIQYAADFKKAAGVPLTYETSGNYSLPLTLDLKNIQIALSQIQMAGTGLYKSVGEKSNYWVNLKSNSFPLENAATMVPMMQEYGLSGKTVLTIKAASGVTGPDVKGNANLQGVAASVQGLKVSNINSSIDFTMKDASGKLTASQLKHDYFSGTNLETKWNLTDAADMAKISGTANMKQGPGTFTNIQKLTADSKAAKIMFMPLTIVQKFGKATGGVVKVPALDKVDFKSIVGDYVFKSGVMNITSFTMDGEIGATMKGTVGLAGAQPLDLQGQLKLAAGLIGGTVGEALQDEKGRTTLNMIVKGTVNDPQVTVDVKDAGKKLLNTAKEKYGDDAEKAVKDLLKGLFKK